MGNSVLGYEPSDLFPGPPDDTGTPLEQLDKLRNWAMNLQASLQDFLVLLNSEATQGFGSGDADSIITELNDNGTITIDGDTINIHGGAIVLDDVIDASGDLDSSAYTAAITNSSITLTASGTLNGAGGGSVTLDSITGTLPWDSGGTDVGKIRVPDHFVDAFPTNGSGLIITAEAMGYFKAGTLVNSSAQTGTFVAGEKVIQEVTLAEGLFSHNVTGSSHVFLPTSGTFSGTGGSREIVGQTSGARCTPDTYNATYPTFSALINNAGSFYFAGDGDNYISWDGSTITVRCSDGFIGSSTDYFDITNGTLLVYDGSSSYTRIEAGTDGIRIGPNSDGSSPGIQLIKTGIVLSNSSTLASVYQLDGISVTSVFEARCFSNSNELKVNMKGDDSSNHSFDFNNNTNNYELLGFELKECTVTTDTKGTPTTGDLRINSGNLQYYSGGWRTLTYT
jgi:hypothetical protein